MCKEIRSEAFHIVHSIWNLCHVALILLLKKRINGSNEIFSPLKWVSKVFFIVEKKERKYVEMKYNVAVVDQ